MFLLDYVEQFISARDLTSTYSAMLRAHSRHFVAWSGRNVGIDELDCDRVNAWLLELRSGTKLSPYTIDTYRRNLLAVWRAAYFDKLNLNAPLRVRAIKKPRQLVRAYKREEILKLLHTAGNLRGYHINGNRRRDFWRAIIHAAYSTGLRRSDLLLIFKHEVQPDGTLHLVQRKTGYSVCVSLSPDALKYAERLTDRNGLLLPWPYRHDALPPRFKKLRELAGLKQGSLKWLRRSAASYAEKENPGAGPRLLGHRGEQVFRQHYEDPTISRQNPFSPPPL